MKPEDVLGRRCKDRINNFSGICIGFQDWMFGCRQYLVKGETLENSKEKNIFLVPEPVIEVLSSEPMDNLITSFDYTQEEEAFGNHYCDVITGFSGICIGIAFICYDEIQYFLEPSSKKNKKQEVNTWPLDKGRLKLMEDKKRIKPEETRSDGHKGGVDYLPMIS